MDMIRNSQREHQLLTGTSTGVQNKEQKLWMKGECIWILENDLMLQMKVIVISHCGIGGHRGKAATEIIVRENFYSGSVQEDVSEFVRSCIHCIITRAVEVVPRPLGSALHGKPPNEVVHIDFLYMGPGIGDLKYILVVKDDLSGFVWLRAASIATGFFAADVLYCNACSAIWGSTGGLEGKENISV